MYTYIPQSLNRLSRPAAWVDRPHTNKTRPGETVLTPRTPTTKQFPKRKTCGRDGYRLSLRRSRIISKSVFFLSFFFSISVVLFFNVVRFTWAMIFKWIPCFTVCAQIRRKRLKKKVFFFKKEKKKCDHRHSLKTLPLGGREGGLKFLFSRSWGLQSTTTAENSKNFPFLFLLLLFFCVYFCSLLLWFGPQLPWMRKLLLCRYTHTSI